MPWKRKYTPEAFEARCQEYFNNSTINEGITTHCGLRLHLDVGDTTWQTYGKDERYKHVVTWATVKIEQWLEKKLLLENKPVGAIFQLKSVFGRSDQLQSTPENVAYIYVFGNEAKQLKKAETPTHASDQPQMIDCAQAIDAEVVDSPLLTTGNLEIEQTKAKSRRGRPRKDRSVGK